MRSYLISLISLASLVASTAMSGKYIVVFKDNVSEEQIDKYVSELDSAGGSVTNRYTSVMKGFSATIPDSFITQLQSLESDGVVDYIEPDGIVTTQ